jgi:hypothetical protein
MGNSRYENRANQFRGDRAVLATDRRPHPPEGAGASADYDTEVYAKVSDEALREAVGAT